MIFKKKQKFEHTQYTENKVNDGKKIVKRQKRKFKYRQPIIKFKISNNTHMNVNRVKL